MGEKSRSWCPYWSRKQVTGSVTICMKNVPLRLMCLNTWSHGGGIWGDLEYLEAGGIVEVHPWESSSEVSSPISLPVWLSVSH